MGALSVEMVLFETIAVIFESKENKRMPAVKLTESSKELCLRIHDAASRGNIHIESGKMKTITSVASVGEIRTVLMEGKPIKAHWPYVCVSGKADGKSLIVEAKLIETDLQGDFANIIRVRRL